MAMMLSVMVVGAGAAYKTFPDQDEIKNDEAVFLLNALDIVEGRETGDFDGTANLIRAEAAKLVAALNLGGVPVPNANGISSFSDVIGNGRVAWANDYIEYCVSQGSVNGMGDGTFGATLNVIGVQFAKMLLGILGYDAAEEGYTGVNWEYNVNIDAVKAGLYTDLGSDFDPTLALTRDEAAQMMYNALMAKLVIYLTDTTGALKITGKTLMDEIYPNVSFNDNVMTGAAYNVDEAEYAYTVKGLTDSLVTEADYTDMLGMNVMYVVDGSDVLGVYAYENGAVVEGLVGDYDIDKDDVAATAAIVFDVTCATVSGDEIHSIDLTKAATTKTAAAYESYKAIDNDDDGIFDYVIVYPVDFAEVTYVGENNDGDKYFRTGMAQFWFADYSVYADIAKGDYAQFDVDTTLKTMGIVSELVKQSGKVNSLTSNQVDGLYEIVINGTAYGVAADVIDHMSWAGKNVFFYEINGYIVAMIEDYTTARNFLLITSIDDSYNVDGTSVNANALFGDNTTSEITIAELDGKKGTAIINEVVKYLDQAGSRQHGYLAYYEVVDGKYELTSTYALDNSPADLGFDDTFGNYDSSLVFKAADNNTKNATIVANGQAYKIADDAVVFVADISAVGDGGAVKYSVKSGADIKHLTGMNSVNYAGIEYNDNGYAYVTFAFIVTDNASVSADMTGILTSDVTYYISEDDKYAYFTVWTGDEEVTVNVKMHPTCPTTDLEAGVIIEYAVDAGKIVKLGATLGATGAVTQYADDSAEEIYIDGVRYEFADDAEYFFFNTEDDVAVDASIELGGEKEIGRYENVYFVADAQNVIYLLVVDPDKYDDIQIENVNLLVPVVPETPAPETPDTLADVVAALEGSTDAKLKGEGTGIPGLDANGAETLEGLTEDMIIAFLNKWLADVGYEGFTVTAFSGTPITGTNDHAVVVTISDGTNTATADWTYDFAD